MEIDVLSNTLEDVLEGALAASLGHSSIILEGSRAMMGVDEVIAPVHLTHTLSSVVSFLWRSRHFSRSSDVVN